ncbi:hypothetical protein niasHS_010661 [Heterodera schachtii]|uniref:Innexin n=1 Tax=Heterodera schachtii TaxID=97005 RepID=A0ABD2IS72_HETSC
MDLIGGKAWSDSGNFPRVTFCDIDVRILGAVQRHTVQCILVINIFTEKVFLLLWLWYSLLLLITVFNLFGWLFALLPFSARRDFILRHLRMANVKFEMEEENVDEFVCNFLKVDGCFLLRMIETHTTEWTTAEIVDEIWENFISDNGRKEGGQKRGEREEKEKKEEKEKEKKEKKKNRMIEPLVARHCSNSLPNLPVEHPLTEETRRRR